ncbi:MAG: hypothetical protein Ct9H300mP4_10960 [Gammaproteobacteria bacterium]|nr:MAG: hypothetical protein Ct9H300mP4_10960 [Gammaproteobacteria bacterium]
MAMLIDAGQVSINWHAAVDPAIPFGGKNNQDGEESLAKKVLNLTLKPKLPPLFFSLF